MKEGVFILLLTVPACGSRGGGPDGSAVDKVDTGLPESQSLADLDGKDASQFCEALADALLNLDIEEWCIGTFLLIAHDFKVPVSSMECEDGLTECVSGLTSDLEDLSWCLELVETAFDSCDATVGDFETCATYNLGASGELFAGLTCDDADDSAAIDDLAERSESIMENEPAACARVEACKEKSVTF